MGVKHRLRLNDAKALLVAALDGIGLAYVSGQTPELKSFIAIVMSELGLPGLDGPA